MFQVDQFESVFRSALHDPFELLLPTAESMLVVTDLAQDEANEQRPAAVVEPGPTKPEPAGLEDPGDKHRAPDAVHPPAP